MASDRHSCGGHLSGDFFDLSGVYHVSGVSWDSGGDFGCGRIDGAGVWQIFLQIGVPLGMAGIVSAELLSFLDVWNMIEQPMTFLKTKSLWPLSLFLPQIGLEDAGVGFAAAFAMLVPALLLFLAGQEYLEQGITAAALKG